MKKIFYLILLFISFRCTEAQQKVSFYAVDSLKITADLYIKDYKYPFILLFHQAGYSRGEFSEIAPKLLNLKYNCLAVDLRSGDKVNYILNETAAQAIIQGLPAGFLDARKDILAAIQYVQRYNKETVVLFGSSYSASLCLLLANGNPEVQAVIAFSPGEYFRPTLLLQDELSEFNKPVFVSVTELESAYLEQMFVNANTEQFTFYKADKGRGVHGAKALWESNEYNQDGWLALTQFFNKIRKFSTYYP